jgi:hypothetical protein
LLFDLSERDAVVAMLSALNRHREKAAVLVAR